MTAPDRGHPGRDRPGAGNPGATGPAAGPGGGTAVDPHPPAPEVVENAGTGRALVIGGTALGIATLVANGGNYVVNLLLARWLPPAEFADATLMVTIWLTMSGVALAMSLVTGRFVGLDPDSAATADLIRTMRRLGWACGLVLMVLLAGLAPLWQGVFNTASPWPFVVLAVGLPFHLALAVGRGSLQGRLDFGWLALSLVTEMVVRMIVSSTAVLLGGGVLGATAGLSASLAITWFLVRLRARPGGRGGRLPGEVVGYIRSVAVLLAAQVVLSNVDVLAAKVFLDRELAGRYAAIALIGRGIFFLSWAAATVLFPAAARRHARGGPTAGLLRGGLLAVAVLGLSCSLGALLLGEQVLTVALGPSYAGLSGYLAVYALVTTAFALANLTATHHLSTGRTRESWVLLGGAVALTAAVLIAHWSIASLIGAQLVVMTLTLLAVTLSQRGAAGPRPVTDATTKEGSA